MFRRIAASLVLIWAMGFLYFAVALPQPLDDRRTDLAIVLTGGEGRIQRGLMVVEKGWAGHLLVSGVDAQVKPHEFAVEHKVSQKLMRCCITLGYESVDTRSNARESARWIARHRATSVRLVTSDWHMRRAAFELDRMKPAGVDVLRDAVPSHPSLRILFLEYNKLLARHLSELWGG